MSTAKLISVWFEPDYVIGLCAKRNQMFGFKNLRDETSTARKALS